MPDTVLADLREEITRVDHRLQWLRARIEIAKQDQATIELAMNLTDLEAATAEYVRALGRSVLKLTSAKE